MAFCCKMDDPVNQVLSHQLQHFVEIADVGLHKGVIGFILNVLQVGQVAGICQLVQINDVVFRIFVDKQTYHMTADESGTAGDDNVCKLPILGCPLLDGRQQAPV